MKAYGALKMQFTIIFFMSLFVLALTACAVKSGQPGATTHSITVAEKATLAGEPAKIVRTNKSLVYAFSFDDDGQRTTCQTPVILDENKKIIQNKQWNMHCSRPSLQELKPPVSKRELNLSSDALFDFGKSSEQDMKAEGRQNIEQFAKLLRNEYHQQPQLVLTGYTDRIGPPEANQILAFKRAESVAQILQRSGIRRDGITVAGKGSANPLVDCPGLSLTPELVHCLQPNRRVTIEVIGN